MKAPAQIQTPQTSTQVFQKLILLRNQLVDMFVERENEITASLVSLISGEPMIMVGEPGTAKTKIVDTLAQFINAKYFYYLLTRFTEPDELLGTLDIRALREGKYVRITKNRLPDADIVFLDEIFKASSAVRNILLDIMLNRRFLNGDSYHELPMLTLYTASNEISSDEEDQAFYDRLLIRVFVKPVSMTSWKDLLIRGINITARKPIIKPIMTREDILALREIVMTRAIKLSENTKIMNKYIEALAELESQGIHVSDRRKVKGLIITATISIIYFEEAPSLDSLADTLRFIAVHDEGDVEKVEKIIMKLGLSSFYQTVQKLQTLEAELKNALRELKEKRTLDELKKVQLYYKRTVAEIKRLPKNPRLLPYIKSVKNTLVEARNVIDEYLSVLRLENMGI